MSRKSGYIAIVGRPNAGKSTLLNEVLDASLSIVTPKAQTTRERVLGILTEPRGQIVFVDTPGIHRAKEGGINEYMMSEAAQALDGPSLVWYVIDPRSAVQHESAVLEMLVKSGTPVIGLVNKTDMVEKVIVSEAYIRIEDEVTAACKKLGIDLREMRKISAKTGRGVDKLLETSWDFLPEGPFHYPDEEQISDRPTRFFVAEKIREQLLMKLGEELPYSCAVEIQKFDESATPPRIEAVIHVERDSQKGMVVGKGGAKIKEIGQAARAEIEDFLGVKVFLGLKVSLLKDWSSNADALRRMGYDIPKAPKKPRSAKAPNASGNKRKLA